MYVRDATLPERLSVRLTPRLLRGLTSSWQTVGQLNGVHQFGLTHFARRRLSVDGRRERLHHLVTCADARAGREEIEEVLGGAQLVGLRAEIGPRILAAGAISIALEAAARGEPTTPATCVAYINIAHHPDRHGLAQWTRYSGTRRAHLLDLVAEEVEVPLVVKAIYAKVEATDACSDPLLRAGTLRTLLRCAYAHRLSSVALAGVVYHELVAGGLDPTQSFSYAPRSGHLHHDRALSGWRERELLDTGDLTASLEEFVSDFARAQAESLRHMSRFARELHRLPPDVLSTPDDLDHALFDAVRTLGHPTTRELLNIIPSAPALRTVQRRLQGLVKRGLLTKTGARKDARYRVAEGF
ncbi:MAG TPA: hypothetical protein ENK57_16835 [Polyangiaceae bacterium]|nr:hypothetical protein [Polyangiaceae bacterium]